MDDAHRVFDRKPPQNIEAERATLGGMLLDPEEAILKAINILDESPEPFYVDAHRNIYSAIVDLYRDRTPIDMVTLCQQLIEHNRLEAAGGASYISELTDAVPTSAHVEHYSQIVREAWHRRKLITVCTKAIGDIYSPSNSTSDVHHHLEREIFKLSRDKGKAVTRSIGDIGIEVKASLDAIFDGKPPTGLKTGFTVVDEIMDPMQGGDYIILAATPSVGKTTLAANIAINVAEKQRIPVLFLSLEMQAQSMTEKLWSIFSGLSLRAFRKGAKLNAIEEKKLLSGYSRLKNTPIFVNDDSYLTPLQLHTKVRTEVSDKNVGLVVIDYLQLMRAPGIDNKADEIGEISRSIKQCAKDCGVPIIAVSQFNRQAAGEGGPRLSHLRSSGQLEQDCDIALLLSRPLTPKDQDSDCYVNVDIAKQRTGPTGSTKLLFRRYCQQFQSVDEDGREIEDNVMEYQDEEQEELVF